ncbi:two-component sensor histidine kinase [Pseudaminobacter arsenicus]|uniref:histidine kinase n=1 Tax=Borborobacter arsenicus TaxID=1851146 RepID=A0A432VA09_9HYPH|nr:ATP-binding protein [Pseudaminobacter arsenicus]RUM98956.1 two-component sensor histidine kinase [Pseudaminobacter arsenicus]
MNSIRTRLLTVLLGSTGLVWLLAVAWIYLGTQAELERVLDARLMEAARMVNSLLTDDRVELALAGRDGRGAAAAFELGQQPYERQLSCQIWSLDGALVGRSEHAPEQRLTDLPSGFSKTEVDGETWRVYAIENADLGVRVMVGDSIDMRDRLVGEVIKGLVLPAGLILPFLAGTIWLSVRRGMSPLNDMARTLSSRAATDLRPLPDERLPREIAPAVHALNGLFRRVADAREREKSFTAFAAHELKTPLAGLKTQAQIALASSDGDVHANALRQISAGVDRTSRLVRQLLDLAMIEASDNTPALATGCPIEVVKRVIAEMPPAGDPTVALEKGSGDTDIEACFEPTFLMLALRNLIENALNHSPASGKVLVRVSKDEGGVNIIIEDDGPGIAASELPRITERFFRGRDRSPAGSGLGLSIAEEAAARMGGSLRLQNRDPHGLTATLSLPVGADGS